VKQFPRYLQTVLRDESGQDMLEYALVAALVGLGAVVSLRTLSNTISTLFNLGAAYINSLM
jgi:pilus assembly protein Flp/PilA